MLAPGREKFRRDAAHALCEESQNVDPEVIERLTIDELIQQPPIIAAPLACLIGMCSTPAKVLEHGRALAKIAERRVLLLLLIRFVTDRAEGVGRSLGEIIGESHPAVRYSLEQHSNSGLESPCARRPWTC